METIAMKYYFKLSEMEIMETYTPTYLMTDIESLRSI